MEKKTETTIIFRLFSEVLQLVIVPSRKRTRPRCRLPFSQATCPCARMPADPVGETKAAQVSREWAAPCSTIFGGRESMEKLSQGSMQQL